MTVVKLSGFSRVPGSANWTALKADVKPTSGVGFGVGSGLTEEDGARWKWNGSSWVSPEGWIDDGTVIRLATSTDKVGIGTSSPNAPLEVNGSTPGSVGGFPSGSLHVTDASAAENANAVITGHNSFGGNKQLWYLGSTSSSNDNIAFINRRNAVLALHTNNVARLTISPGGNIGIGTGAPATSAKLELSTTTGALLVSRMTTPQRDALTALDGMIIYNTTTSTFQGRTAGAWVNL